MSVTRTASATALAAIVVVATSVAAQHPSRPREPLADSSPPVIMAHAGGVAPAAVMEVLRQVHQPYAAAKRRELLDSLTARAISYRGAATGPVLTIGIAGAADPGWGGAGGTPDPDALDRLVRIYEQAPNPLTRTTALMALSHQVDPSRAWPTLRTAATSTADADAFIAVMN